MRFDEGSRTCQEGTRDASEITAEPSSLRLLLADDHRLFREGLIRILSALVPDAEIVEASTFDEACDLCARGAAFDLVLLDLCMPGMSSANIPQLARQQEECPIVIVSALDDRKNVLACLDAGAAGYIPKTLTADVLLRALQLVLTGAVFVPHTILKDDHGQAAGDTRSSLSATATRPDGVTARQMEVLELLADGQPNKEIGRRLGLSVGTVKLHVSALLKTLGVHNRTEAVIKATEVGLLDRETR